MTKRIVLKRMNQGTALVTDTLALPPLVIEGLEEFKGRERARRHAKLPTNRRRWARRSTCSRPSLPQHRRQSLPLGQVNGTLGQTIGNLLDGKRTATGQLGAVATVLLARPRPLSLSSSPC